MITDMDLIQKRLKSIEDSLKNIEQFLVQNVKENENEIKRENFTRFN